MTEHFDDLETRDPATREAEQFAALRAQIAHAVANAPAWARHLDGVDPAGVVARAALAAHMPRARIAVLGMMMRL